MGLIRLLLAISVVGAHINSHWLLKLVGGEVAVQAFFVISGFYMAMISSAYKTKLDFWTSRYLRLYPVYIVCALLTLFFMRGLSDYYSALSNVPMSAVAFMVFTNLTIFLQDLTMFLGVSNDALGFVKSPSDSSPPLHQLLLIPQGWSLGIELSFYALAPFILKKNARYLVGLLILSVSLRFLLVYLGYDKDPWSYRFFPTELAVFLIGSIAYKCESINKILTSQFAFLLLFVFIVFTLLFEFIPVHFETKKMVFILTLALLIKPFFNLTKNNFFDNFIGMLSYPIYICHLFVIVWLQPQLKLPSPGGGFLATLAAYFCVITFSMLLYLFVEKPFDIYRKRFKR